MKRIFTTAIISALTLTGALSTFADDPSYLPEAEVNGHRCYYYAAERGESVYGIAEKYGWDPEIFMQFNPGAIELKSGQVVYYPIEDQSFKQTKEDSVAKTAAQEKTLQAVKVDKTLSRPQEHLIDQEAKVAETPKYTKVESSPNAETKANSNTKAEVVSTPAKVVNAKIYTVKENQSIVDIARANHMSVQQLMTLNPGLTLDNVTEGMSLKVTPGSDMDHSELRQVTDYILTGQKSYKVKKDDSWSSIAHKHKIDTLQLQQANPTVSTLVKGEKIIIPQFKAEQVERMMPVIDPRESSVFGLQEIYDITHERFTKQAGKETTIDVGVIVGCSDAGSRRRDLEFLKGFMLGVQAEKYPDIDINIRGVDLADYGSLDKALESHDMDNCKLIFCSVDKDFPQELIDYCDSRNILLFNVFDAKTDIAALSPNTVQILPPSEYFYDRTSDFLTRVMNDRIFLFVNTVSDDPESMSGAVRSRLFDTAPERIVDLSNAESLANFNFDPTRSYTVISDAGTKKEIAATLNALEKIVDEYPNMPLSIVGRASWIVYANSLEQLLRKLDTYIPSRFIYDSDSEQSKAFVTKFRSYYDAAPVNSLPMYSVMGYDVAQYFMNEYIKYNGDLNHAEPGQGQLQIEFRPEREEAYDGFLNKRVYLLHFTPFSTTEKISL
ncbi:MAG: LysM peptidoglycan-binding domain-containing protein [Muribaculaceae bacterium]|nr:LysM peptidoglycan-binding domain-containing protein [Muribaculaceae bacterium]